MLRKFKDSRIERIKGIFEENSFAILVDFAKSSTDEIDAFKTAVRNSSADMYVAKNTLAKTAIKLMDEDWIKDLSPYLIQSTGLVYGAQDIGSCAKVIKKFHRGRDKKMQVKAIVFDKQVYGPDKFAGFTELLSKDELRARLLGLLMAPQSNFVRLLKAAPRSFVAVVKGYADKQE